MSTIDATGPSEVMVLSGGVRLPRRPAHPERVCWGCPLSCHVDDMRCGSDVARAPHPFELFGERWDVNAAR